MITKGIATRSRQFLSINQVRGLSRLTFLLGNKPCLMQRTPPIDVIASEAKQSPPSHEMSFRVSRAAATEKSL